MALLTARSDRSRALNWIQIGAIAGPTIELPSVALRSANLRLQGNGQGAVSTGLPGRAAVARRRDRCRHDRGQSEPVPLADVESVWSRPEAPGKRTVLVP